MLKTKVVELFNNMGVPCSTGDIEVIHRLGGKKVPKPVILRARRDFLDEVLHKRKNLAKMNFTVLGFPEGTKVYLNNNLSPQMRTLAYNCRNLKRDGLIDDTWVFNSALNILTHDNKTHTIYHEIELYRLFKEYSKFTFDTSFYETLST